MAKRILKDYPQVFLKPENLDGWIDFDQMYSNGAAHPGDGPDVIGCRCVELFRSSQ